MSDILNKSIEFVKGIGPVKAELLQQEQNIYTVGELILKFPFRYVDKTVIKSIASIREEETVQVRGRITSKGVVKGKRNSWLKATIRDNTGSLELVWFRGVKWVNDYLELNKEYIIYGKITRFNRKFTMAHPEMESTDKPRSVQPSLDPVYPGTEKLNKIGFDSKARRKVISGILSRLSPNDIPEILPKYILDKLKLIDRYSAIKCLHFPKNQAELDAATNRIKFEESFFFQLRMLYNKKQRKLKLKGSVFETVGKKFSRFYDEKLEFELTNAQKRVIKEIRSDLGSGIQMNRLLQGDVGSGKTIVALLIMLIAIDNGYQSVLMAPTEILAQQHYESITELLKGLGVRVAYLTGSVKGKVRNELLRLLKSGDIDILIGTHAVLENPVTFKQLGLAIIDEQHRFGVMQRSRLWQKGFENAPHVLVMTATPIPRTLAMTVYGDLDVSVIDELPPGRKEIKTIHKTEKHRSQIIQFMHEQIKLGRQIYVVYPLIEESSTLDLANLQEGYENLLQFFPPPDYKISVVHGKMKPADKDIEMKRFASGSTHIMVATTVIEVGVNVPNASVMVIENTERFGLSQLHQLRGRVGRGAEQSYCVLMSSYKLSKEAKFRINTMTSTNDGFKIAEADLELRGPGDIEGTQQSGVMEFNLFSFISDHGILNTSRHLAELILEKDPQLKHEINAQLKYRLHQLNKGFRDWGRIA